MSTSSHNESSSPNEYDPALTRREKLLALARRMRATGDYTFDQLSIYVRATPLTLTPPTPDAVLMTYKECRDQNPESYIFLNSDDIELSNFLITPIEARLKPLPVIYILGKSQTYNSNDGIEVVPLYVGHTERLFLTDKAKKALVTHGCDVIIFSCIEARYNRIQMMNELIEKLQPCLQHVNDLKLPYSYVRPMTLE